MNMTSSVQNKIKISALHCGDGCLPSSRRSTQHKYQLKHRFLVEILLFFKMQAKKKKKKKKRTKISFLNKSV